MACKNTLQLQVHYILKIDWRYFFPSLVLNRTYKRFESYLATLFKTYTGRAHTNWPQSICPATILLVKSKTPQQLLDDSQNVLMFVNK